MRCVASFPPGALNDVLALRLGAAWRPHVAIDYRPSSGRLSARSIKIVGSAPATFVSIPKLAIERRDRVVGQAAVQPE